jgi:tetratricopeptide (TPR) repeat protein
VIFPGAYFGIVAVLGLAGAAVAARGGRVARWIIAAILLHLLALMPVFVTERYRLPVVPGLTILAVYGLWSFWRFLMNARYRPAVVYAGLVGVATVFVSWPQRDPALWALEAYNSGWQALECGNLPLAERKLNLARRYVPTNAETNFALGNLKLAEGENQAASNWYRTTLRLDENHRGALNNLGVMALNERKYDFAEGLFRRAEQVDPRNSKTHFLLASSLTGKGNYDAAEREIETAIALNPTQIEFKELQMKIAGLKQEASGSKQPN